MQDGDNNILRGVQVVAIGEAQGHDFQITPTFLSRVVELGNKAGSVKVRVNHPEGRGDVLSIVGEATNFQLDGDCVRADVRLFDVPDSPRLLTLARQAGHLFGMSLDFAGEVVKRTGQKLKEMTCETIFAVDFVDTPAATRALFSAGPDGNRWRAVCALSTTPKVDATHQEETTEDHMDKKLQEQLCKKFGIDPTAKDVAVQLSAKLAAYAAEPVADEQHAEPDGDEGQNKVMAALEGIEKRLAALEGKDGEKTEKLADEPAAEDEEKEEQMATMAAKVCSIMLAKVGVKPRPASAPAAEPKEDEHQLSADELQTCKALKMDEQERKQFAANLARAKQVKL